MAKIDLASLVVRLEAQTAQYQKQLETANRQLQRFQKSTNTILKQIAGLWSVREMVQFTKAVIDQADRMNDLSKSTGFTVESLSQLQYAAEQNGADLDTLAQGMKLLQKNSVAAADGTGEQAKAFKLLGVEVTNAAGQLRPTEALLLDIAETFSNYADGAGKAAIAQQLFGKNGTALIPFLNQGRAGIQALREEADRLGITMSGEAAQAADDFNDALARTKAQAQGVVREALAPLLPQLTEAFASFSGAAEGANAFSGAVEPIRTIFKLLADIGISVAHTFRAVGKDLGALAAAAVAVAHGDFAEAREIIRLRNEDDIAEAKQTTAALEKIWGDSSKKVNESRKYRGGGGRGRPSTELAVPVDQAAIDKLQDMLDGLKEQVGTFGKGEAAATRYRLTIGKMADDVKRGGEEAEALSKAIVGQAAALESLAARKELADLSTQIQQQAAAFDKTDAEALQYRLTMGDLAKVVAKAGDEGKRLAGVLVEQQQKFDRMQALKQVADAMVDVNAQIAQMKGNIDGVDVAKFDAANKELVKTLTQLGDTKGLDRVAELRNLTAQQSLYNAEVEKAARIQSELAIAEERIRNSQEVGALTELQAQQQLSDVRVKAAADLQEVYEAQKAIADETGNPQLILNVKQFGASIENLKTQTDLVAKAIKANFTESFADAFADFATGAASASDAFQSFTKSVLSNLARMASQNLAETIFGSMGSGSGSGGGGFFSALAGMFGGARAMGGPVSPGKAYLVNENTPNSEIFVPSVAGRIEPVGAMGGINVTNHFAITAPNGTVSSQTQQQIAAAAARGISQANRRNN